MWKMEGEEVVLVCLSLQKQDGGKMKVNARELESSVQVFHALTERVNTDKRLVESVFT